MIPDFIVKYDPKKDSVEDLTKKIVYSLFIARMKRNKPITVFLGGDSGEGKSYSAIRFMQILLELQGLNAKDYFDMINIYTPFQYPQKMDKLLFDKAYKKVNVVTMHEAREVVSAKNWMKFITQAVSDVSAMSRTVKRMTFIIVSQFIRDITNDIRYTLKYYIIAKRPGGGKPRLYISVIWKDDRDLEKPRLRKRPVQGYLVYPDGTYRQFRPSYLEMNMPDKELTQMFEQQDYEAKSKIIRKKLERMIKEMSAEAGIESDKIKRIVEEVAKHPERIGELGKRVRNKWVLRKEAKEMFDLTGEEAKELSAALGDRFMKDSLMVKKDEDLMSRLNSAMPEEGVDDGEE